MEQGEAGAPTDALIGAVLDNRYRILRRLGQGGMGMVYLGEHQRTGRKCAVKLLPPEASHDPEAVKRFEREARVLGTLGHPGIVGIHDFSETPDGRPFFVMDYLEGEDLATRMKRQGRLSWAETQIIVDEIAAALFAAHQAGVLHRDLKPANVFLARSPAAPERVVLLDFGLAKGGVADGLTLTQSNMVMGTPLYMSPEQARSVGVDARSDIYSLAALTYELLSGKPPFIGPNYTAVLASLLTDPPKKLSESAQVQVPPHLDEVLDIALSKSPEDRQPDVASFATAVLQKRPRWADTTARGVAVVAPEPGTVGVATGRPAAGPGVRGSSMEMAATMASSPDMAPEAEVSTAPTVASSPNMAPTAEASTAPTVASDIVPAPAPVPSVEAASAGPSVSPLHESQASSMVAAQATSPPPEKKRRSLLLPVLLVVLPVGGVSGAAVWWFSQRGDAPPKPVAGSKTAALQVVDASVKPELERPVATPDAAAPKTMEPTSPDELGMAVGREAGRVLKTLISIPTTAAMEVEKVLMGVPGPRPRPRPMPQVRPRPPTRPRPRAMQAPPRNTSGNQVAGFLTLSRLVRAKRWGACVKLARRLAPTRQVLYMGAVCGLRLRNANAIKYFCRVYMKRYGDGSFANTCRNVLGKKKQQRN